MCHTMMLRSSSVSSAIRVKSSYIPSSLRIHLPRAFLRSSIFLFLTSSSTRALMPSEMGTVLE